MPSTSSWKGYTPPDLEKTTTESADAAKTAPEGSYDKIIRLPIAFSKKYRFWFTYLYEDAETKKLTEGPRSPTVELGFDIPNLTKPVINLSISQGYRSYGLKFDIDPLSIQEDIVVYESLSADFANPYIVYVGTSTNITIQTGSTAQRWVKVVVRDKWLDTNRSESAILTVTPLNPDPDTTYTVANPTSTSANASIDPKDLSGFSVVSTMTWSVATDTKTAGYSLRWSTTNPSTGTPLWEYASVDGRTTNSFTATGLIPNTTYYYQVAAVTPYDVVNWTGAATSTFIASDADGTAAGALARLKSFIAIGGATQDLFKIGTGIAQSINLNTEPLANPTLTAGTYHGIILNKSTTNVGNNFWLTTGQFRVGNSTEFMYWNGTDLNLTGNIEATGGKFTGNVQLAIPTGGTTSGSLYAGASATSGARLRLNNLGIFAYDGLTTDASVAITAAGLIDARKGYIGGWTISATSQTSGTISRNNTILDSNGNITVGDTTGTLGSAVRLSATDPTYRLWIGSTSSSNAPFRVDKDGKLYATGAVFSGYATTAYADAIGTAAATDATTKANAAKTAAQTAAATDAQTRATAAKDAAILASLAKADFNKDAIVAKLAPTNSTTTIDGGLISTGTIKADAVVSTFISAFEIEASKIKVGTLTGHVLQAGLTGTSYYMNTKGNKAGIDCLVVNAIGIESSRTGGVTTHWYPYTAGGNFDLGIKDFPWSDLRNTGTVMVGYTVGGSDTTGATNGPKTKLFGNGTIYGNTLGTVANTTTAVQGYLMQDNSGFFKVYTGSSSIKYKENVESYSIDSYSDIINAMRPVTYNYKPEFTDTPEIKNLGLIAEEVLSAGGSDYLVGYKDGEPEKVHYSNIPIYLVGAFKEMSEKISVLQSRLDALGA